MANAVTIHGRARRPRSPDADATAATTIEAIPGIRDLWRQTVGDPGLTVGVVDGLPDLTHPCFAGADVMVREPWWLPEIEVEQPCVEHATFIASVLFGQHDGPVRGLVPRCRGLVIPALRNEATALDPLNAARAVDALADAGADIVLLSIAHPTVSDDTDGLFKRAVTRATELGVLIVAPAGNDNGERRAVPAILPEVLAVGAVDADGIMFRFSNWGAPYRGHGIVAPGGDTWAARPGGGTVQHKGTSVAAPIVAGVAALLASLRRQRGLPADLVTVRDALLASARPCTPAQSHGHPDRCLAGSLNVPGATRLALAGAPAVEVSAVPRMSSVYTIGRLGYDFGTDTRRDAFAGRMAPAQPTDPRQMAGYLTANPSMATELIWTVLADDGPIYAVEPAGAYADELYELLRQLFVGQLAARHDDEFVERISVPGRLDGRTTRLLSDQIVPVVEVREKRGMYGWTVDRLVADTIATLPSPVDPRVQRSLRDFLVRSYDELRSRGAESRDRALNFAATNPVQAARALAAAVAADLTLDTIAVEKSPFCRLGSDCQEIKLRCHDPEDDDRAVRVWRFTIDVSDVLPVTLGEVRAWAEI